MDVALFLLIAFVLLAVNAVGVVMVALQLPGTWVMVLCTAGCAWFWWGGAVWSGGEPVLGWWSLAAVLGLAVAGEVAEFVAGAAGAKKAGGSKRAAGLAIVGGVAGALVGTFVVPVPIVGTLLGAAVGAGVLSAAGDKWAGREWGEAVAAGKGAAVGKLTGSAIKLVVACVMWVVVAVALIV